MLSVYISQCLVIVLVLSIGPLILSSTVGLVVALVQTATQIQEQSLSFLVKFLTICCMAVVGGNWFLYTLKSMFEEFLLSLAGMGNLP